MNYIFAFDTNVEKSVIIDNFTEILNRNLISVDDNFNLSEKNFNLEFDGNNYIFSFIKSFKSVIGQEKWILIINELLEKITFKPTNIGDSTIKTKLVLIKDNGLRHYTYLIVNNSNEIIF